MLIPDLINVISNLSLAIVAWLTWWGKYNKYLKG